jgi:peroxiredoxin
MLSIGMPAPDFALYATPDKKTSLSEFIGKRVILVFYPADWSPICGDQMALYNEVLSFFQKHHAVPMGISVDSKWCHSAFRENRKLHFHLLADFEPKGEVARAYKVYDEAEGEAQRALYIIDEFGLIRWNHLSDRDTNPGADGILDALEEMGRLNSSRFQTIY